MISTLKLIYVSCDFINSFSTELYIKNILSDKSIESYNVFECSKTFSAWNVEENKCTSSLTQSGTLPELSMGFMGLRAYVLKLDCQGQGNWLGRIYFEWALNTKM